MRRRLTREGLPKRCLPGDGGERKLTADYYRLVFNRRAGKKRPKKKASSRGPHYFFFTCFAGGPPRIASSGRADAGGATFPSRTISLALSSFPYRALLAPSSDRNVEPSSDTPANSPCDLEYDRISAFMTISVSAEAPRPTAPAPPPTSPPTSTFLPIPQLSP